MEATSLANMFMYLNCLLNNLVVSDGFRLERSDFFSYQIIRFYKTHKYTILSKDMRITDCIDKERSD